LASSEELAEEEDVRAEELAEETIEPSENEESARAKEENKEDPVDPQETRHRPMAKNGATAPKRIFLGVMREFSNP
jgi:hypothetical protein